MDITDLRLRNLFGGGASYDQEDPFQISPRASFQSPDPFGTSNAMSGVSFAPKTQNSVFADQSQGKEHPAVTDSYNRLKSILDSYTPDTTSSTRLNNLLDNAPQMNNPGVLRRIAAAGAALGNVGPHFTRQGGGIEAADRVKYAPYINAMMDWKEKVGPAQAAATNENQRNIQERTLTSNMLSAAAAQDRADQASKDADTKNEIIRQKNEDANKVAIFREQTRRIMAENPDWKPDYSGTKVKMVNSKTGEIRVTDIDTNKVSEQDRLDIEGGYRVKAASASGAGNIRIGNQVYVPDPDHPGYYIPAGGLPTDQGIPSRMGGSGTTTKNSSELNKERQDRMREVYERNGNEQNVTQFLHPDATNKGYTLEPRPVLGSKKTWGFLGSGITQKDLDTWDLIKQEVDPGYTIPPNPKGESAPAPPPKLKDTTTQGLGPQTPPAPPIKNESPFHLSQSGGENNFLPNLWNNINKPTGDPQQLDIQRQITQLQRALNDPSIPGDRSQVFDQIQGLQQQLDTLQKQSNQNYEIKTLSDGTQLRTSDGGKTGQYSYDGGVHWGPKR